MTPITREWLTAALERVDDMASIEDWDGQPVTADAMETVRALVHALSAWHIVAPKLAPQIVPSMAGGISIVWREQGYQLDMDIESDGRISGWLHRNADGAEVDW